MRPISAKNKAIIKKDEYYKTCARKNDKTSYCGGRITIEHALIYAGRQLDELYALVPLCARHHAVDKYQDGGDLCKDKNVYLALIRATDEELRAISKAKDYIRERKRLGDKYKKDFVV